MRKSTACPGLTESAVVVCYLKGVSQAQAASQLHLAESTVRGRLARARKMLGQRLMRRGVALSTGLLALGSYGTMRPLDRLPGATAQATARAALLFVKRGKAMPGVVSATAQSIANGVLFRHVVQRAQNQLRRWRWLLVFSLPEVPS